MLLSIEKLIYGGDGLARTAAGVDGRSMAVFVPFVLPGEIVDATIGQGKAGFARGRVTRLIEASPHRIAAGCPYFGQCGGCHYQHIPYAQQLQFKAAILRETLQRIAKVDLKSEIRLHASPPWNYRNRTRLRLKTAPEFALGYFRMGSHDFLPVRECPISSPLINRMMARLLDCAGLNCPASVLEIELFANASDERLLAWAFCRPEADKQDLLRWAEALAREWPEIGGMTFFSSRRQPSERAASERQMQEDSLEEGKLLAQAGAKAVRYQTQNHQYQVSAGAFFQVNRHLIDQLISVVTGNVQGDFAIDLYAGVGLFSAALANNFRHILAVEASQTSHGDLRQNAPANVKAVGARTEDYLSGQPVRKRPDLVVLDPPRTGLGKTVTRSLVELQAPRLRYVSCDPATLARDLPPLLAAGYGIEEVHLFDLFPETFHIESAMLLMR
ncbi:MAG: 23S rRNA (uracil(1939)-C(5))-methyltransferase RlmD [Terriglobales bacterium]